MFLRSALSKFKIANPQAHSGYLKPAVIDSANSVLISSASLWEITIKVSLGKLELSVDLKTMLNLISKNGFEVLHILPDHLVALSYLPDIHRDPFDRLLIAQSISENIPIVSSDKLFDEYKVVRIW